jgi:hypothetical protein
MRGLTDIAADRTRRKHDERSSSRFGDVRHYDSASSHRQRAEEGRGRFRAGSYSSGGARAADDPRRQVQMAAVPASVAADDRATYLQILKANGGNAVAALAAIQAMEAKEQNG